MRRRLVGPVADFPPGSVRGVDARTPIAVWRLDDGTFHATADLCTHYFWSLSQVGELDGAVVTCIVHGAEFDVRTGANLCLPARLPLATFTVDVTDAGLVYVDEVPATGTIDC
jgi:3-phenylpropionate/trans-cinnamate dioxygenase ferredoxin component